MFWLSVAGGVFLAWLILVFLFTPGINYHNDEVNVALSDPAVNLRLCEDFDRDLEASREMTLDMWRRRPLWEKIVEPFVWILERQQ